MLNFSKYFKTKTCITSKYIFFYFFVQYKFVYCSPYRKFRIWNSKGFCYWSLSERSKKKEKINKKEPFFTKHLQNN